MDSFDGYVFLVPEYNHSYPGALKNALDYVYREWNDKAAGIISYGGWVAGARAAEALRRRRRGRHARPGNRLVRRASRGAPAQAADGHGCMRPSSWPIT